MREFRVDQDNAGKRLDRWLSNELPLLPTPLAQKYIRLKRVKLNGKGAQRDTRLAEGDHLQLYINDEFFGKPEPVDQLLASFRPHLFILYEDENLLLVDKQPGLVVHPDENEKINTLITHVHAYLYQKGEWNSKDGNQFAPALCNRIDRFTGGIVIVAKNAEALHVMNQKIRDHEVEKYYLCVLHGPMAPPDGLLDSYISKAETQKRVSVLNHSAPGAQRALTRYRTLSQRDALSLVECQLLTGRTHQIRAQFAATGHPILGDNQYGDAQLNQRYGRGFQALCAYKLAFSFHTDAGVLNSLNGRSWQVKSVPFVGTYFPGQEMPHSDGWHLDKHLEGS